ncbi:MAG: alcohol dehydrogenase catalytic domain-containing protein [Anaerolineaceae bacterium]|nr:alcohol dehydrogenase catalytic domain-containing protein [Anaerolineaceae bacterium]
MRANVVTGPGHSEMQMLERPTPKAGEVLIEVRACGVCASDLHPWQEPFKPSVPPHTGAVRLGHEPSGVVAALGEGVTGFTIGQRVVSMVAPAYAEYVCAPAEIVVPIPDEIPFEHSIAEPAACMISALERMPFPVGSTITVIGAGFMGLVLLQLIRARGAGKIIVVDINPEALDNALRFGADEVYQPQDLPPQYLCLEWDHQWSHGIDWVFEITGKPKGIDLAIQMCRAHANLAAAGYHQDSPRTIDMKMLGWKAVTLLNAHERRNSMMAHGMRAALELIRRGTLDMPSMITHQFPLDELDQAFTAMVEKPQGYIKAIVKP